MIARLSVLWYNQNFIEKMMKGHDVKEFSHLHSSGLDKAKFNAKFLLNCSNFGEIDASHPRTWCKSQV